MKLLAVETSAVSASCCVTEDGRVLSQAAVHTKLTHSQTLMPMIDSVLRCAAIDMSHIDRLAVAVGPGSFTGIRIGVAAVKGLALPRNLPCAAVSTLEAMAALTNGLPFDGLVCPVMDARCQQVYTALFDHTGGQTSRLTPDGALPITELETALVLHDRPVYLLGDGAELVFNTLRGRVPALTLAPLSARYQNAVGVAAVADRMTADDFVSPDRLLPTYLRPPQAERELKARLAAEEKNMNTAAEIKRLRPAVPALLDWYAAHRRPLPFRENPTPYRVWVPEIMLQQTRIETVLPYFERFMQVFPTVKALADADESTLFKLWEGLGYYSRARNLLKAAKQTVERFGGELPASYEDLLSLQGIGDYTAGAIASIAFGLPVPAVDGNVLRVVARLTACDGDVLSPATRKSLRSVVEGILPPDAAGAFNEAVMELGETVCLPAKAVKCEECPLAGVCAAKKRGCAEALPVRKAPRPRRVETRTVTVLVTDEPTPRVLLHKRGDGLLAHMWELPNAEGALSPKQVAAAWSLIPKKAETLPQGKHVFSHVEWKLHGVRLTVDPFPAPSDCVWVTIEQLSRDYALPRAFSLYLKHLVR